MAIETRGVLSTAQTPGRPTAPQSRPASPDTGANLAGSSRALELALMRRGLAGRAEATERCAGCGRTMLTGERVYEYPSGAVRCALCRERERQEPAHSRTVHGPEFGHSIRVIDRRSGVRPR